MNKKLAQRAWAGPGFVLVGLVVGLVLFDAPNAAAFSRGLASKVRAMQAQAFMDRFTSARTAYSLGDYRRCTQEAELALQHASNEDQAFATHQLLAAAYKKLNAPASAAPHLAWLSEHRKRLSRASALAAPSG